MRWGLIPSWADDPKIGYKLINARAETVAGKPAFRNAFRQRHCLIPADGFYEWHAAGTKAKQPWHIRRKDGRPFAFAGLWEHWNAPESPPVESCTIITTDANEVVRPIHDRMPVILDPADYAAWLDPRDPTIAQELLRPCPAEVMTAFPVSSMVNNPKNEDPRCLEAVAG
jgi:putative SOS response-associated peptidase YedK